MELNFRKATKKDVVFIVQMLADDPLGQKRESLTSPLSQKYYTAFEKITKDKNQELIVVENIAKEVIGTLQLTFIPYLTYQGGIRAQIEAVRINKNYRGKGLGKQFFEWAINRAKKQGAHVLQLTSDKKRPDAIRFYEKMGFNATHEGMKLHFNIQ